MYSLLAPKTIIEKIDLQGIHDKYLASNQPNHIDVFDIHFLYDPNLIWISE